MLTHRSLLSGLCLLALALATSNGSRAQSRGSPVIDCGADCEVTSILQRRLSRGSGNSTSSLKRLAGLQPHEELEQEMPFLAGPCLARFLAAVPLTALAAVLTAALWSLVSHAMRSDYSDIPEEVPDRLAETVSKNLCMACLWLALHSVVAVYATYIGSGIAAAVTLCVICGGATVYEIFVEPAVRALEDKRAVDTPGGASQMLLLQMTIMLTLLTGQQRGLVTAWLLSLLGAAPTVFLACDICWKPGLPTARWAAISGQAILLATLTRTYLRTSRFVCDWGGEPWDVAGNPELSIAMAAFVLFVFGLFSATPGKPRRRVAFISLLAVISSPGVSALTGKVFLYGPWAMFSGTHEGHRLSMAGYAIFGSAVLVSAAIAFLRRDCLGLDWDRSGQRPSLALVRVLVPFWLLFSSRWGYSMPFLEWHYVGPWGDMLGPALLIASLASLALGAWSHLGALVSATGFFFGLARLEFDTDSPVRCMTMLLLILAYTPCDGCFSVVRHKDLSLWAKSLFRLHMSFLYFWAGLFKVQGDWLKPDGGTLYKDIHLLQGSPLHGVLMFFLRTEGAVRAATTATAWSTVAIELLLAFALWKKSWHLPAIVGAGFLHLAMSCICGELGGFTQAAWIGLLGSLEDDRLEKFLSNSHNFAFTAASCIIVMALIGWAF